MRHMTDDLRIREIKELAPPSHLIREFPCDESASITVAEARSAIHRILHGMDDRLVVVIDESSQVINHAHLSGCTDSRQSRV